MYEYLASVQSAVRRINDRITTLVSKFGNNSKVVNDITSKLDVLLPHNMRYKNGKPQISKPSDIFGDEEKMQAIADIDENMKTWGQYRKQYESEYNRYTMQFDGENMIEYKGVKSSKYGKTPISFTDYIQTIENLDKALREIPSDGLPDKALEILKTSGRKNTYNELLQVHSILLEKGMI